VRAATGDRLGCARALGEIETTNRQLLKEIREVMARCDQEAAR
jgi:hypothetical protein